MTLRSGRSAPARPPTPSTSPTLPPVAASSLHTEASTATEQDAVHIALTLFPDRDAAIFELNWTPQPYVPVGYSELAEGCEIGVAGYPLPQIVTNPAGGPGLINFTFRVAKGVVTAAITQSIKPGNGPATAQLNTLEVNFLFVPGNSGGPIFDAETGRVFAYVHGYQDREIVQRYVNTNTQNIGLGAPAQHVQSLHAVYSLGIRLDGLQTELESFGVSL